MSESDGVSSAGGEPAFGEPLDKPLGKLLPAGLAGSVTLVTLCDATGFTSLTSVAAPFGDADDVSFSSPTGDARRSPRPAGQFGAVQTRGSKSS